MTSFGVLLLSCAVGCTHKPASSELFNETAVIPSGAPIQPLQWRVISSSIDAPHQTMSTLFGNDAAIDSARTAGHTAYPAGAVLAMVTWNQREDEHWFGGRIPKEFQSMEIVRVTAGADGKAVATYEELQGPSLQRVSAAGDARMDYILGQRASVMP
ncbi:cytochrome P460 family protein [Granulicella arctica]|uniref:cytochrome P460 family protein n=1 Tax=Granulicella arctica TaxID=940613 RepID=UPI0021E0A7FF|nr:cytochrome P460 family protein [Granulicella arctica]